MKHRQEGESQVLASAKAGFSERSGRRIEKGEPKPKKVREHRTRKDPFKEIKEKLKQIKGVSTLFKLIF